MTKQTIDTSKITRLTVVMDGLPNEPNSGRLIEKWDISLYLDVQDDGKTLKIFMKDIGKSKSMLLGNE